MKFGSPQKELMPGARNAVETCLGVRPGEHVTLIADEASRAVAASIAAALDERRAPYTGLLLEDFGPRPMNAAPFDRGLDWVKTSGLISPRYWSNLPAGEVFTTPATVDGTFVCDATAGDHFNGKYGDLQATPLMLEIHGARLIGVTCARKDLEQEFWDYSHTDENSDRVGELAFGTNLGRSEEHTS